ncbi:adenylyl-sulfate kinase [Sporosarcina sp. P20a]|uniref:adenylyl-sulfate kinase n=1 Tax=Sporosarcina sp. P20a TaxID=2048256 RepID=UPI000C16B44F|nr:adenylyl-sulfate kinase [Sporosarcina sp. P20a]PIC85523.1 adenylyl-sulfate kinase [Sporosarcina sp. P20a]
MAKNIVWHEQLISKEEQRKKNKHHSAVLYFTGLSGSGKSTIANAAARRLHDLGANTYVLDGDNVRHGLNKDLGFSDEARKENIRRIGEVSKLFIDSGQLVFTAFISPFQEDRDSVRRLVEEDEFVEVYISCPLDACEERDPKGLYEKARAGVIPEFTGISSPYEAPEKPELTLKTDQYTVEECVEQLIGYLRDKKWIN